MSGWFRLSALSLCATLCAPALASASPLRTNLAPSVQRTQLPFGTVLIVHPDNTVPSVALELWFRAPSAGWDTPTPGIARYAATAIAASKLSDGRSVSELVKGLGGRLNINVYADAISIAASVPAGSESSVMRALSAAYFTPVLSVPGIGSGLRDTVVAATQRRIDPEATLRDAVFAQLFSAGPAHYPTLPEDTATLTRITPDALRAFASRAFRSSNAVVAAAGNIGTDLSAQIRAGRVDGLPMEQPLDSARGGQSAEVPKPFAEDAIGMGWAGPPIADAKAATALDLVADYVFRPESGVVAKRVADDAPDAFLSGQFITLHSPGVLLVAISGKGVQGIRERVETQLARLRDPLPAATFAAARDAFEYHILADTQTPLNQADNFGWYTIEGDGSYAPSDAGRKYLQTADSLDPAYLASVVRQYLNAPTVVRLTGTAK